MKKNSQNYSKSPQTRHPSTSTLWESEKTKEPYLSSTPINNRVDCLPKNNTLILALLILAISPSQANALSNVEPHPGYWMLEKTEVVEEDNPSTDAVLLELTVENGRASGSCSAKAGGMIPGFSQVTWTPMPATASHRQEHIITFDGRITEASNPIQVTTDCTKLPDYKSSEEEWIRLPPSESKLIAQTHKTIIDGKIKLPDYCHERTKRWDDLPKDERNRITQTVAACYLRVARAKAGTIGVSASGPECPHFHSMGELAIPNHGWSIGDEKTKTLKFTFPHVSKVYMCSGLDNNFLSENNYKKIRDATQTPNTLRFSVNFHVTTAGGTATFIYHYVWVPGKMDEKPVTLTGRVTDGHNHPMPYMRLTLTVDGVEYPGFTDEAGNYEFKDISGLSPDAVNPPEATLKAEFSYVRDGVNYMLIMGLNNNPAFINKKFWVRSEADLVQNIDLLISPGNTPTQRVGDVEYENDWQPLIYMGDLGAIYYYTGDAIDFSLTILEANLNHQLPVQIYLGNGTYYSPGTAYISIDMGNMHYTSTNRPKNREYHEFAHHLMRAEYGGWPGESFLPNTKNHGGFLNPSTADSYIEGFAEFMAAVMSEYTNCPDVPQPPSQYFATLDIEDNYKVWERRGKLEEIAIAGALWDMYDAENEDGDRMTLTIHQMWPILRVRRNNFYEYYLAFKEAFPEQSDAIDDIMLLHGIFADNNTGNNVRNNFEPYRDTNNNNAYDDGEFFIDYGVLNSTREIRHEPGETIGRATNYQRPERGQAVELDDAFIKVEDTRVTYYTVSVTFKDPKQGRNREATTEMREGLIYLPPLPEDVDATYTLKPKSYDYTGNTYTITTEEYNEKWYASQGKGYMDTHDFELKPTGEKKDPKIQYPDGYKPRWGTDRGYNVQEPPPEIHAVENDNSSACFCIPLLPMLLAGLATLLAKA
jgi:hypothetical protein